MTAYRAESVVKVRYELSLDELERANRDVSARPMAERASIAIAIVVAGVAVALFARGPWGVALAGTVAVGGMVGWLYRKWMVPADRREQLAKRWEGRRDVEVELSEDGVSFADELSESWLSWEVVLFWRETEDAIFLHTSPHGYHLIPKRALSASEAQTTTLRILADRVRRGDRADLARASSVTWAPVALVFGYLALLFGAMAEGIALLIG